MQLIYERRLTLLLLIFTSDKEGEFYMCSAKNSSKKVIINEVLESRDIVNESLSSTLIESISATTTFRNIKSLFNG